MSPEAPMSGETASLMPLHGTVSNAPAARWEDALAAGNGIMGALLFGDPVHDTLIANHCKCWLPLGSREIVPQMGDVLPEMRRIIGEEGYDAGQRFFLSVARQQGWDGNLVWTDPFHPGFILDLQQHGMDDIADFARVEDFSTGTVWSQWRTDKGHFVRRMFVSRTDNAIVVTTSGPQGEVSLDVTMQEIGNAGILSTIKSRSLLLTCHNVYAKGKGGYDAVVRVEHRGGTAETSGYSVKVTDADSVTLLMRIQPWKTPLADTEAWPYMAANPDFSSASGTAGLYRAAHAYNPQWMVDLVRSVAKLPGDYDELHEPHTASWREIYDRVSIDLGGSAEERAMPTEVLLDKAQEEQRLSAALLERMYDAGRYVYLCSAGPETPPNLYGIWTGTWKPEWSGDYTTDTNLQLDIECAYSCNMAESMAGYFNLWDSYVPDFQRNARGLYGCRGMLAGSRASNNGLALHWNDYWPGNQWTPGAPWIAHWYYDHFLYTGDRSFLRDRAVPYMEQCALFYEDFLAGSEDQTGNYTFRPSYSAENGFGDNASQDIQIAWELLTNLIAACELLEIKADDVARWKAMLGKLPPLLIDEHGALQEWSNSDAVVRDDHRHLMHLYGAFESGQFSEETDAKIFAAAKTALHNRINASQEDCTHGFMHMALAGVGLGMGDVAFERLEMMAKRRSIFANMVNAHNGGPRIFCDDGNGATPEIVNRMIVQSRPGQISLLPALPHALPKGELCGTRARGGISIDRIAWDLQASSVSLNLTSDSDRTVDVVMPPGAHVVSIRVEGCTGHFCRARAGKAVISVTLVGRQPASISSKFLSPGIVGRR